MSNKNRRKNQLNQLRALQKKLGINMPKKMKKKGLSFTTVKKPAAMQQVIRRHPTKTSHVRFRRKELLTTYVANDPVTTDIHHYVQVNPGDPAAFTWLEGIAVRYEMYKWNSVRLVWVPAVPTSASGNITFAPNYDPLDDPIEDEDKIIQAPNSIQLPVWQKGAVKLTKAGRKWFFVLDQASLVKTVDLKTYTEFAINSSITSLSGITANSVVGKLFIEYDVSFKNETPVSHGVNECIVSVAAKDGSIDGYITGESNTYEYLTNDIGFSPFVEDYPNRGFSIKKPGKYVLDLYVDDSMCTQSDITVVNGSMHARSPNGAVENQHYTYAEANETGVSHQGVYITATLAVANALAPAVFEFASWGLTYVGEYILRLFETDSLLPEATSNFFRMSNHELRRNDARFVFLRRFPQSRGSWFPPIPQSPKTKIEAHAAPTPTPPLELPTVPEMEDGEGTENGDSDNEVDYSFYSQAEVTEEIRNLRRAKAEISNSGIGPDAKPFFAVLDYKIALLRARNRELNGSK